MNSAYQSCIDACINCAKTCRQCTRACLGEDDVTAMAECIRLNNECAAICDAAAQLMILDSTHANAVCQLCADICQACGDECQKHQMDHCQECAAVCHSCAQECMAMTAA